MLPDNLKIMKKYKERIKELIESLADGRVHQYKEVEHVIKTIVLLVSQKNKKQIIEVIEQIKYY